MATSSGRRVRVFTVLVVEDDPDVRELFGAALRRAGFLVEEAATLSYAMEFLRSGAPADVAVLDHDLPDGDGFDVARALRDDASIRALAVTGHTERQARLAAKDAGCDGFITKPCAPSAVVAGVRALLEGRAP